MVEIEFGVLSDPIIAQLKWQGYSISEDDSVRLQRIADAIIILKLARVIPDSVVLNAERKLIELITKSESLSEKDP